MTAVEERWQERLAEARVEIGSGLEPELLAERYDVETEEEIEQLTTQATKEMIRGDHTILVLDDLDVAAEKLEEAGDHEVATDGGVDQSSNSNQYDTRKMVSQRIETIDDVNNVTRAVNRVLNGIRSDGGDDVRVVIAVPDRSQETDDDRNEGELP